MYCPSEKNNWVIKGIIKVLHDAHKLSGYFFPYPSPPAVSPPVPEICLSPLVPSSHFRQPNPSPNRFPLHVRQLSCITPPAFSTGPKVYRHATSPSLCPFCLDRAAPYCSLSFLFFCSKKTPQKNLTNKDNEDKLSLPLASINFLHLLSSSFLVYSSSWGSSPQSLSYSSFPPTTLSDPHVVRTHYASVWFHFNTDTISPSFPHSILIIPSPSLCQQNPHLKQRCSKTLPPLCFPRQ